MPGLPGEERHLPPWPGQAGWARALPLRQSGDGRSGAALCPQGSAGREEPPRPLTGFSSSPQRPCLGLAQPLCSQAVGLAGHPAPVCSSYPKLRGSWDLLLTGDAPPMLSSGWWQRAVPRLVCSWEAARRVARVLLTQIYSSGEGGQGQVPRCVPLLQELGKPCLAGVVRQRVAQAVPGHSLPGTQHVGALMGHPKLK